MWYPFLADFVVIVHCGFVFFVLFGGLLTLWWPRLIWLHLPAVAWGALVEVTGWICPLTPLEHWLRLRGGAAGYEGDFVRRYVFPLLYPDALTQNVQLMLGALVLTINASVYGWLWSRQRRHA